MMETVDVGRAGVRMQTVRHILVELTQLKPSC